MSECELPSVLPPGTYLTLAQRPHGRLKGVNTVEAGPACERRPSRTRLLSRALNGAGYLARRPLRREEGWRKMQMTKVELGELSFLQSESGFGQKIIKTINAGTFLQLFLAR